jgi:phosphate ABC transporter permease subunit PstA
VRASAERRLKRRYREEGRFRAYGLSAIAVATAALVLLLVSIVGNAIPAFTKFDLTIDVPIDAATVDPAGLRDPERLGSSVGAFTDLVRGELRKRFPEAESNPALRRQLSRLVSSLSAEDLAKQVAATPSLVGQTARARVPVSDTMDIYLKGLATRETVGPAASAATVSASDGALVVSAPGAFAGAREIVVDALRREAAAKRAAADSARVSSERLALRLQELESNRTTLGQASGAALSSLAEAAAQEDADRMALARAAGSAAAGGDPAPLRTELARLLGEEAKAATGEAAELIGKSRSFGEKAARALRRGEPTAETRRIQSDTALSAALRRQADADLAAEKLAAVPSARLGVLLSMAHGLAERPVAPLARLALAETEADRIVAARAVNAAEVAAAQGLIADQERTIARQQVALAALKPTGADQVAAIEPQITASGASRLARLKRELAVLETSGQVLAGLAGENSPAPASADVSDPTQTPPAAPDADAAPAVPTAPEPAAPEPVAPAPVTPSREEVLQAEIDAQVGLDYGGALGVAEALGRLDAGDPNAEAALRALLLERLEIDLADVRRDIERLQRKADAQAAAADALLAPTLDPNTAIELGPLLPSVLAEIDGGVVKAARVSPDRIEGQAILGVTGASAAAGGDWRVRTIHTAEADRLVSDHQASWARALLAEGKIERVANLDLLTRADSTYPELAGLLAALVGSFWIILVTLVLSLPIGVMAAIYLQEFAPKNRITDIIEVNINNLAAVPSIVFGLLSAAVFINFFNLPRSAPIVGGMVLSLITLPTVIIATRAALGAVPPSIRDGALAVGASLPQAVFHHMLPLAAPGIMTGAIIGLARALGETAPLLLIGMVAFVAEAPDSMFDSATALPVLVYKWASAAERAWQPMTSAAILVLLAFMFAMNALAVYLRRRLERRW